MVRFLARGVVLCALVGPVVAAAQDAPAEPAAPLPNGAPEAMAHIDRGGLREHAFFLASDELGGRYTGSEGQEQAAEYIAKHFEGLGLAPLGDKVRGGRGWFQGFPVERTYLDPSRTSIRFGQTINEGGFAVVAGKSGKRLDLSGTFVFCGTGASEDLPRGSLKRKIPVVVLRSRGSGGPRASMVGSLSVGRARNVQGRLENKGAKAVLFCVLDADSGFADRMNVVALLPGKPLLKFGHDAGRGSGPMGDGPAVFAGPVLSQRLLEHMGVQVDGDVFEAPKKSKATGRVSIAVKVDTKYEAKNVVAVLEGEKLGKEAIVFSAHMDHMGTRMDGDAFNGADDNASGSSGLLEIAEAFAKGPRPQRSIVFLSVSGEELGLWGSEYFSDNPTWPLKKIVANVNIDMIGRSTRLSDENQISVTPSYEHSKFSTLVREAARLAAEMGIGLTNGDTYYQRSDHYNFARKGIPVVFFCDGEHEDYHKVTDHADKLDYAKMERVARLAYWVGWEVSEAKGRPRDLGSQSSWLPSR